MIEKDAWICYDSNSISLRVSILDAVTKRQ